MARYIDADKLIAEYDRVHIGPAGGARKLMVDAPTADVEEVVRCRNCMHCEIVIDQFDNDWYFCKKTKDNAEVKPDDFCSYGERKDA